MPNESNTGRASGFTVEEDREGGFRWSAYAPAGTRQGQADSRAEAETAAHATEQALKQLNDRRE